MASARTLIRKGATIATRILNSPPSSTRQTLISSQNHRFLSPPLSNPNPNPNPFQFFPLNDVVVVPPTNLPSPFPLGKVNEVEDKTLEIVKDFFPFGHPSLDFFLPDADDSSSDPMILFPKRTFQPSTLRRKRNHGFFARKATRGGRRVIKRRIAKGRYRITA